MAKRIPYRGLKCPECGYALDGLSQPICPECGTKFNPDWLYSVDYVHAIQWTRRRRAIAWTLALLVVVAMIVFTARAGGEFVCMWIAVLGVGVIVVCRRMLM